MVPFCLKWRQIFFCQNEQTWRISERAQLFNCAPRPARSPEQDLRRFVGYSAPGTPSAVTPSASAEDGSALTASVRGHAADAGADSAHSAGPVNPAKPFHAHPSALARAGSAPDAAAAHAEPEQAPSAREPAGAAEEQALGTPATAAREDVVGALQLAERVASGSLAGPSRRGPPSS